MAANSKQIRGNGTGPHVGDRGGQLAANAVDAGNVGRQPPRSFAVLKTPLIAPAQSPAAKVLPIGNGALAEHPRTHLESGELASAERAATVGLEVTEPTVAQQKSIQICGNVDGLDSDRRLAGWAWTDAAQPDDAVDVHVYENEMLVAQGLAAHYRPDVKAAGYGSGKAGFLLSLPETVFDGSIHRFDVRMMFSESSLARTYDVFLPSVRSRNSLTPVSETSSDRHGELYVPGRVVSYVGGARTPAYQTQGWGPIDDSGAWMQSTDAVLEFVIRRPADSYILELEVVPGPFKGGPPELELYFNYMRIGFASLPVSRLITCRLPGELFVLRKSVIGFHCRNALESVNGGMGALALRSWTIY